MSDETEFLRKAAARLRDVAIRALEVAKTLIGGLGENAAHRAQPGGPREGGEVAAAVTEVDHRARRLRPAQPPGPWCSNWRGNVRIATLSKPPVRFPISTFFRRP